MSKVLCVRHAAYYGESGISDDGRLQAATAAEAMRALILPDQSIKVYASPVRRGAETAQIIADLLSCPVEEVENLAEHPSDDAKAVDFLREVATSGTGLSILVTHFWTVKYGLTWMGNILEQSWPNYKDPKYVHGWIVDLAAVTYSDFAWELPAGK